MLFAIIGTDGFMSALAKVVSSPIKIQAIDGSGFTNWWPEVSRWIEASNRGSDGVEFHPHLAMAWSANKALMWVVIDDKLGSVVGASMTRIQDSPTGKILWIIALSGERVDEWGDELMLKFRTYAKRIEATRIRCQSIRPGMGRFLERYGWSKVPVSVYEFSEDS